MPNDKESVSQEGRTEFYQINYGDMRLWPVEMCKLLKVSTDNKNRSAGNVRSAFTKGGGNMGTRLCSIFKKKVKLVQKNKYRV